MFSRFRIGLVVFGMLLAVAPKLWAETNPEPSGHYSFPDLPLATQALLVASLVDDLPFDILDLKPTPVSNPQSYDVWRGNVPVLDTEFKKVTLRLLNPKVQADAPLEFRSFQVEVQPLKNALVIWTSRPALHRESGGVRMVIGAKEQRRGFVEGLNETGLVFLVPRQRDEDELGLVLCPRNLTTLKIRKPDGRTRYEKLLVDSGFELGSVTSDLQGKIEGKMLSGLGLGRAAALLQVSPDLPPTRNIFDESYGKDPRIEVPYVPVGTVAENPVSSTALNSGLHMELELHTQAGFKRRSVRDHFVQVKQFLLDQPLTVPVGNKDVKLGTGNCIAFVLERSLAEFYEQQELVLPERLRDVE